MTYLRLIFLFLCVGLLSCEFRSKDSNRILIIAVEKLGTKLNLCEPRSEQTNNGFVELCQNSIRFSHAYSPSTQGIPALTSVLTGLYPFEHQVRLNSVQFLKPEFDTVTELAREKNMFTALISGGPPLFRKSGLSQGFEIFDDYLPSSIRKPFRPIEQSFEIIKSWMQEERHFFGVLYAPDLLYTETVTTNDLGEIRNSTFDSQVDELSETLFHFFDWLKKHSLWDQTTVILVGLNSNNDTHRSFISAIEAPFSDKTHVALFVKPSFYLQKNQHVDQLVSLVDLGQTLIENLSGITGTRDDFAFQKKSLTEIWLNPDSHPSEKPIVIENLFDFWRTKLPVQIALRNKNNLYFRSHTEEFLFNVLSDPNELHPLSLKEPLIEGILKERRKAVESMKDSLLKVSIESSASANLRMCLPKIKSVPVKQWAAKDCDNVLFSKFMTWLKLEIAGENDDNKESAKREFIRYYTEFVQEKELFILALQKGRKWNVRPDGFMFLEDFEKIKNLNQLLPYKDKISKLQI